MRRLVYRAVVVAAVAVFVAMAGGCEQEPPGSRQTETDVPFEPAPKEPPANAIPISNAADLAKIGKNSGYPLNGVYKLTGNITTATGWQPLGGSKNFSGAFYGMNNTITVTGGGGIFASLKKATVYNIKVVITATASEGHVGGIANSAESSLIDGCEVAVTLSLAASGHNASAGGIVGYMTNNVTVSNCTASGTVTLTSGMGAGLMVYAGGIAGYSGTGFAGTGESYCRIEKSRWTGSAVTATGGYPYAGGVVGYNYTGATVAQCSSEGAVTATGGNLPYAGGVAGYNSRVGKDTKTPATIENCYSTAAVAAVSTSKIALAGGIAGANAAGASISKCYATGAVAVTVSGSGTSNTGGSTGVMIAANAGGIAGAQYVSDEGIRPAIAACAALNTAITGTASPSGSEAWNIYRIAGAGAPAGEDTGVFKGNIAWSGMAITPARATGSWAKTADGKDGEDCAEKPGQAVYAGRGWDFTNVWKMSDGYPVLR
jgi:hypothetical protein